MNKFIGIGRLTREPEVRYTTGENQTAVARYTLAIDRRFKRDGEQTADFINCVAFGKQGEFVERYLHKGMKIAVEGRIQTGSYEKDGRKSLYNGYCRGKSRILREQSSKRTKQAIGRFFACTTIREQKCKQ